MIAPVGRFTGMNDLRFITVSSDIRKVAVKECAKPVSRWDFERSRNLQSQGGFFFAKGRNSDSQVALDNVIQMSIADGDTLVTGQR